MRAAGGDDRPALAFTQELRRHARALEDDLNEYVGNGGAARLAKVSSLDCVQCRVQLTLKHSCMHTVAGVQLSLVGNASAIRFHSDDAHRADYKANYSTYIGLCRFGIKRIKPIQLFDCSLACS